MKNSKKGILGIAATFGIGIALFAAAGIAPARADGDDWRYHDRDHNDHGRYEQYRDHDRLERIRIEEARERRIEQERRERARIERERRERWEREHDRWNRDHHDRDRDHFGFDFHYGTETRGDRG